MPLDRVPVPLNVGRYPVVYLVDSDVLPLQIFDTARPNGTLATLAPGDLEFYERLERELNWLNDVWVGSGDALMRLSVLGSDDLAAYRRKVERDRQLFGDCVVEVDPLDLKPVTARTPGVERWREYRFVRLPGARWRRFYDPREESLGCGTQAPSAGAPAANVASHLMCPDTSAGTTLRASRAASSASAAGTVRS
jgi:hypothetical protein